MTRRKSGARNDPPAQKAADRGKKRAVAPGPARMTTGAASRAKPKFPSGPGDPPPMAFDVWLTNGLHELFDEVAHQPVPDHLLALINGARPAPADATVPPDPSRLADEAETDGAHEDEEDEAEDADESDAAAPDDLVRMRNADRPK